MKIKTPSRSLDHDFWARFARDTWERRPAVFPQISSPLVQMDPAEIFRLTVLYAEHCRKSRSAEGFKFFLDGQRVHEDEALKLLPRKSDKSLLGYHERMNAIFEDYCLVCDELLRVNFEKHQIVSDFTAELYRHVGFPNRFAEIGLYLGNYRKTPFGVHVDGCGVFSFPVIGKKKFRIWDQSYIDKNPSLVRAFKYEKHKAKSMTLEAGPGDMTYWPSSSWHIAESDGSFSATWSLGVWVDRPHSAAVHEAVAALVTERLGPHAEQTVTTFSTLHEADGEVRGLPPLARKSLEALEKMSPADLELALLKNWMVHVSKEGLKTPPRTPATRKLTMRTSVQKGHHPLLWLERDGRVFICVAGTIVDGASAGLLKLVKALNAGKRCKPEDYLKGRSVARDLEHLQTLADAGAFLAHQDSRSRRLNQPSS